MRQIHHWAALLFVASIGLHMLRIFFTGAFRKPRELNWVIGFILFVLAMAEGFTGYSLPDDLLSGNGLRHHRRPGQGHSGNRHLDLVPAVRRRVPGHQPSSGASTRCTSCYCPPSLSPLSVCTCCSW